MGIQGEHFDALVEDLVKALNKFKVKEADKQTLLGVLGPMKSQIVEERSVASEAPPADAPAASETESQPEQN
jgi:uncharacterized protein YejL (UPF0352 family)